MRPPLATLNIISLGRPVYYISYSYFIYIYISLSPTIDVGTNPTDRQEAKKKIEEDKIFSSSQAP